MKAATDNRERSGAAMSYVSGRSGQQGSVMVMAVVLSFAMFLMGIAYLGTIDRLQQDISTQLSDSQAYYAAYGGMMTGIAQVKSGQIGHDYNGRWQNWYNHVRSRTTVLLGESGYMDYGIQQGFVIIGNGYSTFSGWGNSSGKKVSRTFDISTFADYLYLSDKERDPVRHEIVNFWTPDTLDGKVHSNDTLHVSGSPRFMKRVTSSAPIIVPTYNTAQFDDGLYLNQPRIYFPDQYDEIRIYNGYPGWGTSSPDSATEITFSGNQIYRRYCGNRIVDDDTVFQCVPSTISDAYSVLVPVSGALFINGKVIVKADRGGSDINDPSFISQGFSGKMTLASSDTMIIPDNLVYRSANPDNSVPDTSRDVLGLISENYIMFGEDVDDTIYVNAAMAAINGSITVQDIYHYGYSNEKQSLFVYGSLAQRERGLVHSSYPDGQHRRGFIEKDYHYDTRLQKTPPPHFLPTKQNPSIYHEDFFDEG